MAATTVTYENDWLEIGKIVAPQGLQGELRVYPDSDFPERFLQPGERWLQGPNDAAPRSVKLLRGRFLSGKGLYVIRLEGVESREQAEALRNSRLLVPASDRPPLDEDEFHIADLLGLQVFDQHQQRIIGTIITVIQAGNDLLEVQPLDPSVGAKQTTNPEGAPQTSDETAPPKVGKRKPKRTQQPKTWLIPFVKAIVPVVDLSQNRVEIIPPKGLLD